MIILIKKYATKVLKQLYGPLMYLREIY